MPGVPGIPNLAPTIVLPKKPIVKLVKKVKAIHWIRLLTGPKTPLRKEMLWDNLKEIKLSQKEIEDLFELKVLKTYNKGLTGCNNNRSKYCSKCKETIL